MTGIAAFDRDRAAGVLLLLLCATLLPEGRAAGSRDRGKDDQDQEQAPTSSASSSTASGARSGVVPGAARRNTKHKATEDGELNESLKWRVVARTANVARQMLGDHSALAEALSAAASAEEAVGARPDENGHEKRVVGGMGGAGAADGSKKGKDGARRAAQLRDRLLDRVRGRLPVWDDEAALVRAPLLEAAAKLYRAHPADVVLNCTQRLWRARLLNHRQKLYPDVERDETRAASLLWAIVTAERATPPTSPDAHVAVALESERVAFIRVLRRASSPIERRQRPPPSEGGALPTLQAGVGTAPAPPLADPPAARPMEEDPSARECRVARRAALYDLADMAARGRGGVRRSASLARRLLALSAREGHSGAQRELSHAHATGALGVPRDDALAVLLATVAALGGDTQAMATMGYRYMKGYGVPVNCQAAARYWEGAAEAAARAYEQRVGPAMLYRHRLSDEDISVGATHDPDEVVEYFAGKAERGSRNAQTALGQVFYHGLRDQPRDMGKAEAFLERAVEQGDPVAKAMLGRMHVEKVVTAPDAERALRLLQEAAAEEVGMAHASLGQAYEEGLGVERNATRALGQYMRAGKRGYATGYFHAGRLYLAGVDGRPADPEAALAQFARGAAQGNIMALHAMAKMHRVGLGTRMDCDAASRTFKTVAESSSHHTAMAEAYDLYTQGDAAAALLLYSRLADQGRELAQHNAGWLLTRGWDYEGAREAAASIVTATVVRGSAAELPALPPESSAGVGEYEVSLNRLTELVARQTAEVAAGDDGGDKGWGDAPLVPFWTHTGPAPDGDDSLRSERWSLAAATSALVAAATPASRAVRTEGGEDQSVHAALVLWARGPGRGRRGTAGEASTVREVLARAAEQMALSERARTDAEWGSGGSGGLGKRDSARPGSPPSAATVLDTPSVPSLGEVDAFLDLTRHARALRLFRRSSAQGDVAAHRVIGDAYFYALGGVNVSMSAAARRYRMAADRGDAQATFSLAYMHEYGLGVVRDLPLAKRHYDLALDRDEGAFWPVQLAVASLTVRDVARRWWQGDPDASPGALLWQLLLGENGLPRVWHRFWRQLRGEGQKSRSSTSAAGKGGGADKDGGNSAKSRASEAHGDEAGEHEPRTNGVRDRTDSVSAEIEEELLGLLLVLLGVLLLLIRQRRRRRARRQADEQPRGHQQPPG